MISFSGGRTSAYMLHEILRAHGGTLPDDVVVAFANTGKEREETLRFVRECGSRWGVHIHWLEWRNARPCFDEVGYNSASRNGEPFAALIAKKKRLPNWKERWCTGTLKVEPLHALAASFGWKPGEYVEVIGLRHDEGLRVLKGLDSAEKHGRRCLYPLAKAKVTKRNVMEFWARQPFDLGLRPYQGNCDLCFLKGRGLRKRIIRERPDLAGWWDEQERTTDQFFDRRDRVQALIAEVQSTPEFPDFSDETEFDAECGLHCAWEAAA
ncbi:phosphoadenosine phosphosulfate reductase family protein [Rhodomicrobium udaipurense]|uniref:phosphoadenosine phosphosulfate reductase family protein n=1 Tax=Rhodomicrobium udaipurense TaxID=1202716 RepID=UPI00138E0335|nr:phosphoadenosine phosphosulfate reductase family protein [Rhodomicrobium udaipurense]